MSNKDIRNKWSIEYGDYQPDIEYNEKYLKDGRGSEIVTRLILILLGVVGIILVVFLSSLAGKV
jgi:hypothetical protein